MAGALMQLVAYGAQDVYLTGNPQITFFKVVYKRHTNFAMELIEQTVSGSPDFGQSARVKVSRAGDLLHDCWVRVTLPQLTTFTTNTNTATVGVDVGGVTTEAEVNTIGGGDVVAHTNLSYCNRVGFRLLKSIELRIGGQQIDRHTSLWMHLWTELSTPAEKKGANGLNNLVGNKGQWHNDIRHAGASDGGQNATNGDPNTDEPNPYAICGPGSSQASNSVNGTGPANLTGTAGALNLWVPLQFSFCRNPGLALPLIALQYHEVELVFELSTFQECLTHGNNPRNFNETTVTGNPVGLTSDGSLNSTFTVWGNYIFLDTEERKNFAQNPHEYLIETVQDMTTTASQGRRNYRLNFNHPVKELVWTVQRNNIGTGVGFSAPTDEFENGHGKLTITEAQGLTAHSAGTVLSTDGGGNSSSIFGIHDAQELDAEGKFGEAVTGQFFGGDPFTDFTTNARTVYFFASNEGAAGGVAQGAGSGETDNTLLAPALSFPGTRSMVNSSVLRLNGQERFAERTSAYFNRVQPYQHHTGCPDLGINSYSFALKPEEHQPSGTCNFSRIDNAELVVDSAAVGTLNVFAHGYNVLRVASGMGGLAYSN